MLGWKNRRHSAPKLGELCSSKPWEHLCFKHFCGLKLQKITIGCNPRWLSRGAGQGFHTLVIISNVTVLTSDSHLKKTQPRSWSFPQSRKSEWFSLGRKPHLCHSGETKALPWWEQLSHSLVLNTKDHKIPAPSSKSWLWEAPPYPSKATVSEFLLEEASSIPSKGGGHQPPCSLWHQRTHSNRGTRMKWNAAAEMTRPQPIETRAFWCYANKTLKAKGSHASVSCWEI